MITIEHKRDVDGWHYSTVKHSDFRTYNNAVSDYAIGWTKPNYPMPAIPLIVDINPDEITMWSDPSYIGPDLVEWRKALVTWSIYGPRIDY